MERWFAKHELAHRVKRSVGEYLVGICGALIKDNSRESELPTIHLEKCKICLWVCKYVDCDHGMGLAGGGGCPGDPLEKDCDAFTTEYSDCSEGEDEGT